MVTCRQLSELSQSEGPLCLALGVFDGLHVGHQEVIRRAVEGARVCGGRAGVLTFEPHPVQVLSPERAPRRLLASLSHKVDLLERLGVEVLVVVPFTKDFAEKCAADFLTDLAASADLRLLAMGEDWRFGKGRRGDVGVLQAFGEERGILIEAVPAVMMDGERVSSTRIRQALRDGNLRAAEVMLGRKYSVLGQVVEGKQLGRQLGFPTANVVPQNEQLPCEGVWAVEGLIEGELVPGVANLGRRPTVERGGERTLEVHFPGWSGDLYGRVVEVRFVKWIREEKKFTSLEELKEQITRDIVAIR